MNNNKNNSGFTLIELMVVISIIGILAGLSLGVVSMVSKQNRIAATRATVQKLEAALNNYYTHAGSYPPTPEDYTLNADVVAMLTGDLNHDKIYNPNDGDLVKSSRWRGPYIPIDKKNTDSEGNLNDMWGRPYRYYENENESPRCDSNPTTFLFYSLGPDRKATDESREQVIDFSLEFNRDNIKNWEDE